MVQRGELGALATGETINKHQMRLISNFMYIITTNTGRGGRAV